MHLKKGGNGKMSTGRHISHGTVLGTVPPLDNGVHKVKSEPKQASEEGLSKQAAVTPHMLHLWSQINSLAKVRLACYGVPLISVLHLVIRTEANFWCGLIFGERFPQRSSRLELGCMMLPPAGENQTLDHLYWGISQQIKMANKNTPDGLLINEFHWEHLRGVRGWVAGWWCGGTLRPRPVESIDFYTWWFLISGFEVGGKRVTRLRLRHY